MSKGFRGWLRLIVHCRAWQPHTQTTHIVPCTHHAFAFCLSEDYSLLLLSLITLASTCSKADRTFPKVGGVEDEPFREETQRRVG